MHRFGSFILIELTYDCNLRCRYCYLGRERDSRLMSYDTFRSVIDEIFDGIVVSHLDRKITIELHGGEPLLAGEDFICSAVSYILCRARERKIGSLNLCIQTNGLLLTERILRVFRDAGVSLGVSLDGIDCIDNSMRLPSPDLLRRIENNLTIADCIGMRYGLVSVVSDANIYGIESLYSELRKRHSGLSSCKMIPMFDTEKIGEGVDARTFLRKVILPVYRSFLKGRPDVGSWSRVVSRVVQDIISFHTDSCQSTCNFRFCGSGLNICSIGPEGELYTCDRMNTRVREESKLRSSLRDPDLLGLQQLRSAVSFCVELSSVQKKRGCDSCTFRYSCTGTCAKMMKSASGSYGIYRFDCELTTLMYGYIESDLENVLESIEKNYGGRYSMIEDRALEVKDRVLGSFGFRGEILDNGRTIRIERL